MDREQRVAETFVELADTLVDDFDMIEFLQVLAARCVELLGVSAAGIMLAGQGGSLVTVAASDEGARLLELFEVEADEGPCPDCYRLGTPDMSPVRDVLAYRRAGGSIRTGRFGGRQGFKTGGEPHRAASPDTPTQWT